MRIDFLNYNAVLIEDFVIGDTALPISAEDTQILLDGMTDGDYTLLQVSGQLFTEVIKVTKSGSVLVVERAQCGFEERNFMKGDCVIHYVNAAECDGDEPEFCECTICDLTSPDDSIIINTNNCEITVNPDLFYSTLCDDLGVLDDGDLLSGDFMLAFRVLDNGERQCFKISTDDLCERLNACVGGGDGGVAGPVGPQGPQGPAGPVGAPGLQGPQGLPGQDGADGADGANGADGSDGIDGISASSGDAWIDVDASGVVTHNDAQAATQTFGGVLEADDKGHVIGLVDGLQSARFVGDFSLSSVTYSFNLDVSYDASTVGPHTFTFQEPMPHADYFVIMTTEDGQVPPYNVSGKTVNSFAITTTNALSGTVLIYVHA